MPTPEPETEVPTPTQNSKEKTGEFFSSFNLGRCQGKWMERSPIQTMTSNRPKGEVRSQAASNTAGWELQLSCFLAVQPCAGQSSTVALSVKQR